jgi:hypothetical protein
MAATPTCYDNPASILRDPACVSALSKDLRAHLKLSRRERQRCADRRCVTLKTVHRLEIEMDPHECDSPTGRKLNGLIQVPRLVTIFDRDGLGRGVHAGDFSWSNGRDLRITGRMSGITNAGLLRAPVFKACEKCRQPFVLYGRLCGRIFGTRTAALEGCQILANYRIAFEADEERGVDGLDETAGPGTLEGAVICLCTRG